MNKVLNYKVLITQSWVFEKFRLSKEEFDSMPRGSNDNAIWYAWADRHLSRSKRQRFKRVFVRGTLKFYINTIEETIINN